MVALSSYSPLAIALDVSYFGRMYDEKIKHYAGLLKEAGSKHYDWYRNTLLVSSTLLGIMATFGSAQFGNCYERWAFLATISLLGIGILAGSVVLYGEVSLLNKNQEQYYQELSKQIQNGEKGPIVFSVERDKIYDKFETASLWAWGLSVVGLVAYAFLRG